MTALGEIQGAVISRRVAQEIAGDYPQLDVVTEVSFNQFQSWISAHRHSALADSLDSWIKSYKGTPDYDNLLKRYGAFRAASGGVLFIARAISIVPRGLGWSLGAYT